MRLPWLWGTSEPTLNGPGRLSQQALLALTLQGSRTPGSNAAASCPYWENFPAAAFISLWSQSKFAQDPGQGELANC